MEDRDRQIITSNLSKLVLRTQWNDQLEKSLFGHGVFKPKMIDLIKVILLFSTKKKFYFNYLNFLGKWKRE